MFNIGEKVTCEYFDDDEIFEIIRKRRVIDFADDGETVESDEFRYDIDSENEFDEDVPESVLHSVKTRRRFIDGKEYELKIGLIVKYYEELDQLISEDGFTIEASCYDNNGKCDFCSEFDIVSHQSEDKPKNYWKECCRKPSDKDKPDYGEFTFYIKNE